MDLLLGRSAAGAAKWFPASFLRGVSWLPHKCFPRATALRISTRATGGGPVKSNRPSGGQLPEGRRVFPRAGRAAPLFPCLSPPAGPTCFALPWRNRSPPKWRNRISDLIILSSDASEATDQILCQAQQVASRGSGYRQVDVLGVLFDHLAHKDGPLAVGLLFALDLGSSGEDRLLHLIAYSVWGYVFQFGNIRHINPPVPTG